MSGLDFSSESNSTVKNPTIGSQVETGSAGALNVDGYKSNQTINLTQTNTDYGVIGGALGFAGDAVAALVRSVTDVVDGNEAVSRAAIASNESVAVEAMNSVERGYAGAGALLEKGLSEILYFGERSLDSVNNAVDGANRIASDALFQAGSIVNLAENLNNQNTYFLQDVNRQNSLLVGSVVDRVTDSTGDVINTITDLEESRMIESGQVIKTIKELAEVVQTGGESIQQNVNKMVVVAVVAVAGIIAWRALA